MTKDKQTVKSEYELESELRGLRNESIEQEYKAIRDELGDVYYGAKLHRLTRLVAQEFIDLAGEQVDIDGGTKLAYTDIEQLTALNLYADTLHKLRRVLD